MCNTLVCDLGTLRGVHEMCIDIPTNSLEWLWVLKSSRVYQFRRLYELILNRVCVCVCVCYTRYIRCIVFILLPFNSVLCTMYLVISLWMPIDVWLWFNWTFYLWLFSWRILFVSFISYDLLFFRLRSASLSLSRISRMLVWCLGCRWYVFAVTIVCF